VKYYVINFYSVVPKSDSDDCDKAVKAAKNAFESWSETSVEERAAFMFKIADLIMENLGKIYNICI
jgi:aminomuconate-semialdehyde/2-hydroxymuconate-6-semialdehyde dehydrogenase